MLDIIELLKIVFLSIVQGITEWLPISSTGHMRLIDEFMPLQLTAEFKDLFFILVQLGSIFAVMLLYFNKLNPFAANKERKERLDTWKLWSKVVMASVPAMVFGFALDDYMDAYFNTPIVIASTLILYGIAFIWIESERKPKHAREIRTLNELSYADAFKIGIFQSLALIPGTSRSGATIIGGLLIGTSRYVATEFSFFMSIPAMFGASTLKLVKYIKNNGLNFSQTELIYLLSGMFVAFIVSLIVIKFLLNYIKRNNFKGFGYYRIILGIVILAYFLLFG
ncbi:undecaprenyl-diphosphate phosphatase [Aerococcaceae bacterium NML180378]|nr:undecaprenyl-diphosphate phosphatase [Aerococcaceae bacterium NML180378]